MQRNMPQTTLIAAAAALVARFRRQRPLRGGSLIVTIFGDSIMPRGGAIALGSLIHIASPFGLNERLVRTATARLANEGWLDSRRAGNRSEYRLSAGGRVRFAEATRRIYDVQAEWSGRWSLVVLPPMRAADRRRLREELTWNGFGEVAAGVFAHPEAQAREFESQSKTESLFSNTIIFNVILAEQTQAARLVSLGWDLQALGRRYQDFVLRFERVRAALRSCGRLDPLASFIARTLLIHDYRRLHLRDPLLPSRLLPDDWPGARAADLCREIYARVFAASEEYLSSAAVQLDGALPPPEQSVMRRFGGIGSSSSHENTLHNRY
jgi:phenylacetic acid degradation operon negative regulatory protein